MHKLREPGYLKGSYTKNLYCLLFQQWRWHFLVNITKLYFDLFYMSLVSMGCNYLYTKFLSQGRIQLFIQAQMVMQVGLHFCLLKYT